MSIAISISLISSARLYADNIQGESTLGDFIWHDLNNNGLQDPSEPGLNGVLVQLYLDDGDFVFNPELDQLNSGLVSGDNPSTPQREEGWYDFSVSFSSDRFHWVHIADSNYAMGGALNGFAPTKSEVGANENIDSNFDPSLVIETQLVADRNDMDFGFVQTPPASIGDQVWHDLNQNGIQDSDEPGVADVSIALFSAVSRQQIATTQSDTLGRYTFDNLTPGDYYLIIEPPTGFKVTQPHVGETATDPSNDSDADSVSGQTPPISIESGVVYEHIDFGLYQPATIGDRVWEDRDGDGNQDADEVGLPTVTVNLYDEQGGLARSATTDAQGNYFFEDVTPGRYSLEFVTPAGYVLTAPNQSDAALDSDPDSTNGITPLFDLLPGDILLGLDAGMYRPVQVQGQLWEDDNGNGLRESNEEGIQGGRVNLYDKNGSIIQEATTDSSGAYSFDSLPPGDYRVGFIPPESDNFTFSPPAQSLDCQQSTADCQLDSDVDPSTGQSGLNTLFSGDILSAIDAGVYVPATLGDRIWNDLNGNGLQEAGEDGLAGVQVRLYEANSGDLIGTVESDTNGAYIFQELAPGTYYLDFEPPEGWRFSPANQQAAASDQFDSNVDPVTQTTQSFTLQSGDNESSLDAGLYEPLSIGGQSWEDSDGNGLFDEGEPLLAGVTVMLYDENQSLLGTTVTDDVGIYIFDNILPGDYQVDFEPINPERLPFSLQPTAISLPDASGQSVNAAFYRPATLGDWVWLDLNSNSLQDVGEMGLAEVQVSLYLADADVDTPLAQTLTDEEGQYQFTDLLPNNYILAFDNLPPDHTFSPQSATNNQQPATNSDVDPATGQTAPFAILSGAMDGDRDAGVIPPDHLFTLGDRVWHDSNQNGTENGTGDDGEGGIAGIKIELYSATDCSGDVVATTLSNAEGYYQFSGLEEGAYCLHFTNYPTEWEVSVPEEESTESGTHLLVVESGSAKIANIGLLENNLNFDLGLSLDGQIEGLAWCENEAVPNRVYDAGEDTTLAELEVRLLADADCDGLADSNSSVAITTTDSAGHYQFTDLSILLASTDPAQSQDHPTCYVVEVVDSEGDDALCPHAITPLRQPITLHAAQPSSQDHNFGFTAEQVYPLGDRVWVDLNRDGNQDEDEAGLPDIAVSLFENSTCDNDALETTTTDINGDYGFHGLTAGTYCLRFQNLPEHWLLISPNGNLEDGQLTFEDVTIDGNPPNLALALAPEIVTIGDQVWLDENLNGLQDSDEPGVADVRILLLLADGTPTGEVTVTDQDGFYQFTELPPDDYIVLFDLSTLPSDHKPSALAPSPHPDPFTGQTAPTGLLPDGAVYNEADMGIYQPLRIGDRVWEDWNANGQQDPNEPRIPGVPVSLHTADGTVVAQQLTDSAGHYSFTDLQPDEYYLSMDPESLFLPTIANVGDDTLDSDLEDGRTPTTVLANSGDVDDTLDIGLIRPIEVNGRVWLDSDENGLQDEGESGIADIGVAIFYSDGRPVEREGVPLTTQSDVGGRYSFEGLMPGSYYVQFDYTGLADPHQISPQNVGDDDTVDNDTNPENAQTSPTAFLISGDKATHLDLGLYKPARVQVGDRVWLDRNANGLQDEGEPGVAGVRVQIFDQENRLMGETSTDENGSYLFTLLPKGDYSVAFDLATLPPDHRATTMDVGEDDRADSDAGPETGRTPSTGPLDNDDASLDLDLGIYATAQLGDRVWEDRNADGLQDADEPGLAGVTVTLLDSAGQPTGQVVTTDESGNFVFADLKPGSYQLQFDPPPSYFASPDHQGGVEAVERDSNVNADTGLTPMIVLESGQVDLSWDAGFYAGAVLGDFVWEDGDGNGIQDAGELGIPDVLVELFTADGDFASSTTTDATGHYRFEGITPNDYYVRFTPPSGLTYTQSKIGDKAKDSDADPITGRSNQLTLSPGINDLDQDAGFTRPASVGNFVWVDNDGDGIKDGDEPGIGNMVVNIYNADNELVNTMITNSLGFFEFTNLAPGDYRLEFLTPAGYTFTDQNRGGPNDFNSDADPLNGRTQLISLSPGESDGNWGAGIRPENDGEDITAVELLRFEAIQQEGLVQVIWETGEEIDTFGFHLYRSTNGDRNQAARITPNMIRGQGETGGVYQVDDTAVVPGVVYIYWLRETEISGRTLEYGPTGFSAGAASRTERSYQTFLPMVYR